MSRLQTLWLTVAFAAAGCAPLVVRQQADAAFRQALAAQLASREDLAERLYEDVLRLGVRSSAVYNNLAVIAAHRHAFSSSRRLFARAIAADDRDVVALTNYAVMSYCLYDFEEARRAFEEAAATRRRLLEGIPSLAHDDWQRAQYEHATEPLQRMADEYLRRIDHRARGQAPATVGETVASLSVVPAL